MAPMALALIFFALGTASVISMKTGGHPRTAYWNKIFSGIGYLLLAAQGAVIAPYLAGAQMAGTLFVTVVFALLGFGLLLWGIKLRKKRTA